MAVASRGSEDVGACYSKPKTANTTTLEGDHDYMSSICNWEVIVWSPGPKSGRCSGILMEAKQ